MPKNTRWNLLSGCVPLVRYGVLLGESRSKGRKYYVSYRVFKNTCIQNIHEECSDARKSRNVSPGLYVFKSILIWLASWFGLTSGQITGALGLCALVVAHDRCFASPLFTERDAVIMSRKSPIALDTTAPSRRKSRRKPPPSIGIRRRRVR